jgi:hypothetical protein
MKLGLDIHGVLDSQPKFFSELTRTLIDAGWEVHIITGSSVEKDDVIGELLDLKISYTHLFSVHDHLVETSAKTNEELGIACKYPFPDTTWNQVKAEYCERVGINMHIDDMPEYLQHFDTPAMLFKGKR